MSFINKALELAKLQRKSQAVVIPPEDFDTDMAPLQTPEPELTSLPEPVQEICYTCTRTVPVDLTTMMQNRLLIGSPDTMIVQAYKLLRTHILQQTLRERRNVLMVTGPLPNEGKTLTTINLAISMAQEMDRTVMLVDADLHAPSVHRYFGMPGEAGLVDYLEDRKSIQELIVHPQGLDRLVILPAGQATDWATELVRSRRMAELVSELKHYYPDRYVFFDLPPLLSFADALAFAPLVDGILMVVEARHTPREDLLRVREMLTDFPVLGYVFNKVDHLDGRGHYGKYYAKNGNPKKGFRQWLSKK